MRDVCLQQQQQQFNKVLSFAYLALPIIKDTFEIITWLYLQFMISKIKAATDLQINGSMLLNRNKIFDFTSKLVKELYFLMISSKNLFRGVPYRV